MQFLVLQVAETVQKRTAILSLSAAESVPTDDIETEILEFCKTPRSRNEIAEFFNGRMTIAYVMERYVKPMIASGRLIMTIPEKPKSKYQKFLAR